MNKLIHIYIHTDKHTYKHRQRRHIKLRHTATHCNRNQHSATKGHESLRRRQWTHIKTATHCNIQHTATHCNTLQHPATHCNIQQTATKDLEWFRSTANKLATHKDLLHQSRQPQIWAMSHIWITSHASMRHVAKLNESCHTYERVMSHICMIHVTHVQRRHAQIESQKSPSRHTQRHTQTEWNRSHSSIESL